LESKRTTGNGQAGVQASSLKDRPRRPPSALNALRIGQGVGSTLASLERIGDLKAHARHSTVGCTSASEGMNEKYLIQRERNMFIVYVYWARNKGGNVDDTNTIVNMGWGREEEEEPYKNIISSSSSHSKRVMRENHSRRKRIIG
jgi:hypothetical protein